MLVSAVEIVENLKERTNQKQKAECDDWYAYWCSDDTDGYGYAGGHEREADNCTDDATCEFENKGYDAPDGVEGPEDPGYLSFFVVWHSRILVFCFSFFCCSAKLSDADCMADFFDVRD